MSRANERLALKPEASIRALKVGDEIYVKWLLDSQGDEYFREGVARVDSIEGKKRYVTLFYHKPFPINFDVCEEARIVYRRLTKLDKVLK